MLVTETFFAVHIYSISRSLWPGLKAGKGLNEGRSSQCDEVFVNEKGDGGNTDLIIHSASSKTNHYMTKRYIESGLCRAFDLDEFREGLYSTREVRSGCCGHPIALFLSVKPGEMPDQ